MVVAAAVAPGIVIHESMTKFVVLSAICLATAVAIGYPFASVMYRRLYNSAKHYNDTAYRPEKASWDREAELRVRRLGGLGSFVASKDCGVAEEARTRSFAAPAFAGCAFIEGWCG